MNLSSIFPLLISLSVIIQTLTASKPSCSRCPMKHGQTAGEEPATPEATSNTTDAKTPTTDNGTPSPMPQTDDGQKNDAGSKCPMRKSSDGAKKECPFHKIFTLRNIVIGSAILIVLILTIVLVSRYSGVCRNTNNTDHYEIKQ